MGIKIITGHTGENHITATDDASYNRSIYGAGGYVLSAGNSLSASIIDNNTVRISSGDMLIQGIFARIPYGETEDVTIASGEQGKKRNDIIVARYSKATSTGIESVSLVAVKGTATSDTPYDPTVSVGNAESGANVVNLKLYRVRINGISIEGVDPIFDVSPPTMISSGGNGNGRYVKYPDGTMICWGNGSKSVLSTGGITVTFPEAFIDNAYSAHANAINLSNYLSKCDNTSASSTNVWFFKATDGTTPSTGTSVNYSVMAVGRWK